MENKDLQEVVDSIVQAMLLMEERINKKFDTMDDKFNKLASEIEDIKEDIKDIKSDMTIVTAKVDKQGREIERLKKAI